MDTLKYAWKKSIPVMFGYLAMGIAFGILLEQAGYPFLWAILTSATIYAGSMQFILISLITSDASIITTALMTLFINSRHIFYGLSFIEQFQKMKSKWYMVFSLTDETYSVLLTCKESPGVDLKKAYFLISFFHHLYWIGGSFLGGALGQLLSFDFIGIDFAMTALFIVILIEQYLVSDSKLPTVIGFSSGIIFLILLGPGRFILPSLMATVAFLILLKPKIQNLRKVPS